MATITLSVPDTLRASDFDLRMYLAAMCYQQGLASTGLACRLVGIGRGDFLRLMDAYGTSIWSAYTAEDWAQEILSGEAPSEPLPSLR